MKTIKTFSFAFVLLCSLALLIMWIPALIGWAQTSPEPPIVTPVVSECDAACLAMIEQLWQEGEQLQLQQQYNQAAQRYLQVVEMNPLTIKTQQALFRIALCHLGQGNLTDAYDCYDRIVEIAQTLETDDFSLLRRLRGNERMAYFKKAELYFSKGEYGKALPLYDKLITMVQNRTRPLSTLHYDRAVQTQYLSRQAAECLENLNRYAEAIPFYEYVVTLADAKGYDEETTITFQIQNNKGKALYHIASTYVYLGMPQEANDAINEFNKYFAASSHAMELSKLEAQLNLRDAQQAELLSIQEPLASDLLKEAQQVFFEGQNEQYAIQLTDQVITTYPNTAAALRALEYKGLILDQQRSYEKGREAFLAVMQQLGDNARYSRTYQSVRSHLAALETKYLWQKKMNKDQQVSPEECAQLRALCTEIVAEDLRPTKCAIARVLIIESYGIEGQPGRMLEEAEKFINDFSHPMSMKLYKGIIGGAHHRAGMALQELRRFDEALEHFQWIIDNAADDVGKLLPSVYYRIWRTLQAIKAPQAEVEAAAEDIITLFPDTNYADFARSTKR